MGVNMTRSEKLHEKKEMLKMELASLKKQNLINFWKRQFFITANRAKKISPYILVGAVLLGGLKGLDLGAPFKEDDEVRVKKYNLDYSKDKEIYMESSYVLDTVFQNPDKDNYIKIYYPWTMANASEVARFVYTYELKNVSLELFEKVKAGDINYLLENLQYTSGQIERQSSMPYDNGFLVEAKLATFDNDDTLIVEEGNLKNILVTLAFYILFFVYGAKLTNLLNFDLSAAINEVKCKYPNVSLWELQEKILKLEKEIKKGEKLYDDSGKTDAKIK